MIRTLVRGLELPRRLARTWLLRRLVGRCGAGVVVGQDVSVLGGEGIVLGARVTLMARVSLAAVRGRLSIGDRVALNAGVHLDASQGGEIVVGNDVLIGPNVVLRASDHSAERTDVPIRSQGHTGGRIVIEDDVWIGANAVVTRDVRIGAHSIVAAGAVVTRDVDAFSLVAGVPARLVRKRGEPVP